MTTQIRSWKTQIVELKLKQGIHRHQTPPQSRNAASGYRLMVSRPRIAIRPITVKRDVIYKTGSA